MPGEFRLEGDNGLGSVDRPSDMLGAGDMVEIEDPDFMFGENGEIIDVPQGSAAARTPAAPAGAAMSGDARASARVRREHEEGRQAGIQVNFTASSHVFCTAVSAPCLASIYQYSHLAFGHGITRSYRMVRALSDAGESLKLQRPTARLFLHGFISFAPSHPISSSSIYRYLLYLVDHEY
jgi:hypothetical protein